MKSYIPSGSDSAAVNVKKTKFRFYDMMAFLSDVLKTRHPTVQEISTSSSSSQNINETSKIPVKNTTIIVLYTFYTNNYVSENKSEGQLEAALLKALEVLPPAQTIDPPNTFLLHLGEMMQKLPLLERMRVEIDIFKLVADKLESCSNY
ncbi:hypothetical protein PUN28_020610 [Cardiocondyla obscurior]|uniref:BESS domain-containing protein n=1 Tax=Cardiocondyla obscurior TaxID=286306 RepID=A0AAW2E8P8_9HYME